MAQVHRGRLREEFVQDCIRNRRLDHDMSFRDVAVKVLASFKALLRLF
jgi:predicted unusual protein kinase regulating ubiquinone biosynthesis (AarF/ABC1/UbiB family)